MGYDAFASFSLSERNSARLSLRADLAVNAGPLVGLLKGRGAVLVGDFGISWLISSRLRRTGSTLEWRQINLAGRVDRFIQHGVSLKISGDTVTELAIQTDNKSDCDRLVDLIETYLSGVAVVDDNAEDFDEERQEPLTIDELKLLTLCGVLRRRAWLKLNADASSTNSDVRLLLYERWLPSEGWGDAEVFESDIEAQASESWLPIAWNEPGMCDSCAEGWPVYTFDSAETSLCADHCRQLIQRIAAEASRESSDVREFLARVDAIGCYFPEDAAIEEAVDGIVAPTNEES
jgi:hypothetical protein